MTFERSVALKRIQPSATIAITQIGRDLRAAGRDIISLSIGEPDFDTPEHIKAAASEAMARGETKYPPVGGIPQLKAAIAEKFRRENSLEFSNAEVTVSGGAKQVIANALMATLNPGDEVIIPAPYYVSYPQLTNLFGGAPVFVETTEASGYKLQPEALERAINPNTKWLLLNSPGNPTGTAYSLSDLAALAEVLRRHPHVYILSDDIYEHLIYDDIAFATMANTAPDLMDRILTVNGVSKAYAMTGWRIGYGAGPTPLIKAMELVQSQMTSGASTIMQWGAVAALTGPQDMLIERRANFDQRRRRVVAALNEIDGIECRMPDGAFYAYPSCAAYIGATSAGGRKIDTDEAFSSALLQEHGVATVHGTAFGAGPNFRVSYAASIGQLDEACSRIAAFCADMRQPQI
ncbi:MAG: aspartate aminotransferase [Sphingomonadales bacterium]|nr:aspartate aminotransferase [Sphingomonadales bacterium]